MTETEKLTEQIAEKLPDDYRELFGHLVNYTDPETARLIIFEIAQLYGGQQVYFKKFEGLIRAKRDELIFEDFNGHNHVELLSSYHGKFFQRDHVLASEFNFPCEVGIFSLSFV